MFAVLINSHYQTIIFLIFIGRSLGQGTFGKVRLGTHLITGEKVAIKILEKDKIKDQSDVERVTREIHILKIVRHPNVIQLYEVSILDPCCYPLYSIDHRDFSSTLPYHGVCQWW
jgi:serine/threonine protein kinase